jgi:hypothetical protein
MQNLTATSISIMKTSSIWLERPAGGFHRKKKARAVGTAEAYMKGWRRFQGERVLSDH